MPKLKVQRYPTWQTTRELFVAYRDARREYRRAGITLAARMRQFTKLMSEAFNSLLNGSFLPILRDLAGLGSKRSNETVQSEPGFASTINKILKRVSEASAEFHLASDKYEMKFLIFNLTFRLYYAKVFRNLKKNHGLNNNQIREAFGVHNSFIREWLLDEEKNKAELAKQLEIEEMLEWENDKPED